MSIIKLIATVSLAVAVLTMVTSNQLSIYASPTTEDDGWVEGDYEGSSEEQEEQAQEDWEDAGRPGEIEDDDDNENDDDDNENDNGLVECEDGSLVETEELCEQSEALVTCSATQAECPPEPLVAEINCPDGTLAETQEDCEIPVEELIPCSDGTLAETQEDCEILVEELIPCSDGTLAETQEDCEIPVDCSDVPFYMTCHEPDKKKNDNDNDNDKKVIQKTTVIQSATATANANANANTNAADVSNCKLNGGADGIQQKFNPVRYQTCGLYTSADKAYYDAFVAGCMQVGNTKLICETVANSNIVALPAQTGSNTANHAVNNTTNTTNTTNANSVNSTPNTSNPTSSCKLNTEKPG